MSESDYFCQLAVFKGVVGRRNAMPLFRICSSYSWGRLAGRQASCYRLTAGKEDAFDECFIHNHAELWRSLKEGLRWRSWECWWFATLLRGEYWLVRGGLLGASWSNYCYFYWLNRCLVLKITIINLLHNIITPDGHSPNRVSGA